MRTEADRGGKMLGQYANERIGVRLKEGEQAIAKAIVKLEAAVAYGDFLGQLSSVLEIVGFLDFNNAPAAKKALDKMQVYIPLLEANENASAAVREILQALDAVVEEDSLVRCSVIRADGSS